MGAAVPDKGVSTSFAFVTVHDLSCRPRYLATSRIHIRAYIFVSIDVFANIVIIIANINIF